MAEYGSGIFYGRSNRSQSLTNISQIGILSLPPELDIGPPLTPLNLKIEDDVPKDIILLAEFSEIEGPIPLLSIPQYCSKETDLNEVVLQLMATDYHSLGRSDFQIQKDICLLQEDPEKGHFIYAHYFTLYDVRARGFVRPMCLVYITREHKKLKMYFKAIQNEFYKATEYLRICNLQIFITELETRIDDLNFTKKRYIHAYQNIQKTVSKNVEEDKGRLNLTNIKLEKRRRSISLTSDPPLIRNTKHLTKLLDKVTNIQTSQSGCGPDVASAQAINYCAPFLENASDVDNIFSSSLPLNSSLNNLKSHAMSYSPDVQRLAFHIRSHYKPSTTTLSSHSDSTLKGSSKELEGLSYSSDSSNGTVMFANEQRAAKSGVLVSSLMHDNSAHNEILGSNEELNVLQHTSLDALALQLIDCKYILDIVKKYVGKSTIVKEMEQFLADIKCNPQSPLNNKIEELGLLELSNECGKGPSIFVISLMRRNFRNMRSIRSLCGVGYIACVSELLGVFKRFSKSTLTLMFENLDQEMYENPFASLFIGNMPVINIGGESKSTNIVPRAEKLALQDCGWNEDLIELLQVDLSKAPTPKDEHVDVKDNFDRVDVAVADDCLEVFSQENSTPSEGERKSISSASQTSEENNVDPEFENMRPPKSNNVLIKGPSFHSNPLRSTSSDSSWASSTPRELNMMEGMDSEVEEDGEEEEVISDIVENSGVRITQHDIDRRMSLGKLYHTSALIQQFSGVSQCIVHSVLSGKPMIVAGPEYLKSVVIRYTKTLSTILPIKPNEFLPVLKWHTGTIIPHHLGMYKIIGVCIPERLHVQDLMSNATLNQVTVLNIETGHISGVAYSGSLLHKADQFSRRHFRSDISLQAALQSILMTLGMKVFLHFHLKKTTNRSSNDILKAIGVPRGDWLMIQYLSKLVEDQMRENVLV